jgi:hypothetical protein
MLACLVRIDAWDPVAGAAVTLYATNANDDRVCHLDAGSQGPWWPAVKALPPLRYDLIDAGFSGRIETPGSSFEMAIEPWPNFGRYALADARIRLWFGEPGSAFAAYALRFDGRVTEQPSIAEGMAGIGFAVDDRWLDTPLLPLYAGTGGAEGPAALKGQPKPLAIGAPRYGPPVPIDSVNNVFQLSAHEMEGVETAFERLLAFEPSVGDHSSYAALVAATVPPGKWASAKAVGLVRHGAPPAGRLSYHIKGDKAGPDGWVRLPGSAIRRLALLAGGAGRIHDASLTALNASRPYNISWHRREQITAREAIQRIAASVNAVMGVSWLGQMFVVPLPTLSGAATITLDSSGASLPMVRKVEQIETDPPYWRMAIETEVTEEVHRLDEVAGSFVDRGTWLSTESYREGHIVQHQSMAWLYVGAAPSTGNAPPTLPSSSNAWWRALDPRLAGMATGATRNVVYRQVPDPRGTNSINPHDIWIELVSPMRVWVDIGGSWQTAANYVTTGSDIGVENGATRNNLYRQSTAPGGVVDGAFWTDTSVTPNVLRQRRSGAWELVANLVTQGTDIGVANNAGTTLAPFVTLGSASSTRLLANSVESLVYDAWNVFYAPDRFPRHAQLRFQVSGFAGGFSGIISLQPGALPGSNGDPNGYSSAHGWYFAGNLLYGLWVANVGFVTLNRAISAGAVYSTTIDNDKVRFFEGTTELGATGGYPVYWRDADWHIAGQLLGPGPRFYNIQAAPYTDNYADSIVESATKKWAGETGADIAADPVGQAIIEIAADHTGVPKAGELPKTVPYKLFRFGAQVTSGATWVRIALSGNVTTSISGTGTGTLEISGPNNASLSDESEVRIVAQPSSGSPRYLDVKIKRVKDSPPTGSTGGSGNPGTTASTSTIATISSTSHGVIAGPIRVKAGTGGQIRCTFPASFKRTSASTGQTGELAKVQWSAVGGVMADVVAETASSSNAETTNNPGDPTMQMAGSINVDVTLTGRTSGVEYDVQLLGRKSDVSGTASSIYTPSGTFTATGS